MARVDYNNEISYEIFDDGYDIYLNGATWISQRAPYDKMFVPNGTYEENAKAQIDELTQPAMPTDTEKMRADIDYIAMEMDIDLDA